MRRKTDGDKVDGIKRGGGREGKKRPRNGTEGLRMRTNSKKVSGLIICPASDHIKRILFKTDYPPCFVPAVLAGLYWFVERWKNIFPKKQGCFLECLGAAISGSK